jgi:hypothetical protein
MRASAEASTFLREPQSSEVLVQSSHPSSPLRTMALSTIASRAALVACGAVVAMLVIFVVTGVGQDPLQYVHSPEDYARLLLKNPAALRATIGLDNVFIVLYATVFLALGALLGRLGANRVLTQAAVGLLLLLALLDMGENFHFLVMLARAETGVFATSSEIGAQVFESLLKFHVSYLGLFLLGCALPRRTALERTLSNLSIFVQMPIGILIYVTPTALALPLVFARFGYFMTSLILVALIFGKPTEPPRDPSEVDSGAPA